MFKDWKVGQQGWVRLRNGKPALAIHQGTEETPVLVQYRSGNKIDYSWLELDGRYSEHISEHRCDAIEHLPDCTGFDYECVVDPVSSRGCERGTKCCTVEHDQPKAHQWKVGDWFVVPEELYWNPCMGHLIGEPQLLEGIDSCGRLIANGFDWHPSWCRPCDPPDPEPSGESSEITDEELCEMSQRTWLELDEEDELDESEASDHVCIQCSLGDIALDVNSIRKFCYFLAIWNGIEMAILLALLAKGV